MLENDQVVLFPARRVAAKGLEAWAQARQAGYEGLVGKARRHPTWAGETLRWLKVKQAKEGERGWETTRKA